MQKNITANDKLQRSPRKYWEGLGRKILMIPSKSIRKLLAKNKFLNTAYLTDVGYYPKAASHYMERPKGSHEHIIFYCADGRGWYETKEGCFDVYPNYFFVLPANQWHRYGADAGNPWTIYWVMFKTNLSNDIHILDAIWHCSKPANLAGTSRFPELLENIIYLLSLGFTFENLVLANMNLWLMLMPFGVMKKDTFSIRNQTPVEKIIAFMQENIHRKLSIAEIAATVSYSPSHLYNLFRSATGYSPLEYFIHLKMQHACQYLNGSRLRVNEIAQKVGYDDPYLFSRIFTKVNGLSPQKYRENNKV